MENIKINQRDLSQTTKENHIKEIIAELSAIEKSYGPKLSPSEMQEIFEPLREFLKTRNYLKTAIKVMILTVIFAICAVNFDTICWYIMVLARLGLISILNFWDWTKLHNSKCLVKNMNYVEIEDKINCGVCESVRNVTRIADLGVLEERFLSVYEPVIVRNQNFDDVYDDILNDKEFLLSNPCDLETNLHISNDVSVRTLVKRSTLFDSYFFQFRNCDAISIKFVRWVFTNLGILSDNVLRTHTNWVLVNKRFSQLRGIEIGSKNLVVVSQILGQSFVKLEPKSCVRCHVLEMILEEDDSLVFVSTLWGISYMGNSSTDLNMAIVEEVYWDK